MPFATSGRAPPPPSGGAAAAVRRSVGRVGVPAELGGPKATRRLLTTFPALTAALSSRRIRAGPPARRLPTRGIVSRAARGVGVVRPDVELDPLTAPRLRLFRRVMQSSRRMKSSGRATCVPALSFPNGASPPATTRLSGWTLVHRVRERVDHRPVDVWRQKATRAPDGCESGVLYCGPRWRK